MVTSGISTYKQITRYLHIVQERPTLFVGMHFSSLEWTTAVGCPSCKAGAADAKSAHWTAALQWGPKSSVQCRIPRSCINRFLRPSSSGHVVALRSSIYRDRRLRRRHCRDPVCSQSSPVARNLAFTQYLLAHGELYNMRMHIRFIRPRWLCHIRNCADQDPWTFVSGVVHRRNLKYVHHHPTTSTYNSDANTYALFPSFCSSCHNL